MNGEKAISVESGGSNTLLPKRYGILLLDVDSTCVTILSRMLLRFGYKVMTAKRASDALCIIRERADEVDLVLSDACLPDMTRYELLERVGRMSKLPVVIMSADGNEKDIMGEIYKGAIFCLVKPITMNNIKDLWQFTFMKIKDTPVASEGSSVNSLDEDMEDQTFPYEVKQSHRNAKRREPIEENSDDSRILKKAKIVWTFELHSKFLEAVAELGIDEAHPKKILQLMNVRGLKKENISSHLQKHRLSLKREQEAKEKENMNRDHSESHPAPSTVNLQGGLQFPELQSMMRSCQPELGSFNQMNLNSSSMFRPTLDSAYFLNHAMPSCNGTSNFIHGQLTPPNIGFTYPDSYHEGIGTTSHGKLAGPHQIVDSIGETFLNGKTALSSCGDSDFLSALQWPTSLTQQRDEEFLQGNVAFSSCGDSGFGTAAEQWPTLLALQQDEGRKEQQQQQGQEQLQLQQLVPLHQLLPDQEDQDISGSVEMDIDGMLDSDSVPKIDWLLDSDSGPKIDGEFDFQQPACEEAITLMLASARGEAAEAGKKSVVNFQFDK
ncbi:hypothetical protein Q3G72_028442 [Acer saccharum]|nr:hypothetical protein Q3G72_028442 [Acer saccharum]